MRRTHRINYSGGISDFAFLIAKWQSTKSAIYSHIPRPKENAMSIVYMQLKSHEDAIETTANKTNPGRKFLWPRMYLTTRYVAIMLDTTGIAGPSIRIVQSQELFLI